MRVPLHVRLHLGNVFSSEKVDPDAKRMAKYDLNGWFAKYLFSSLLSIDH